MSLNKFISNINAEMIIAVNNNFDDNYDHNRFGKIPFTKNKISFKGKLIKKLNDHGFYNNSNNHLFSKRVKNIDFPFSDFFYLYEILEDDYSKELLIKIIAYRILGHKKVKLPLSKPSFWQDQKRIEANQSKTDFIQINFMNLKLHLTNLNFLNLPITMYYYSWGINIDFIIKQYEFHRGNVGIEADSGDVVIDAGGCFGDTALYFANKVGKNGIVKVFEFIPNNIEILNKNLHLNLDLASIIELIKNPLWNESKQNVYYRDNGPGSKVELNPFEGQTGKTTTLTIDDYVTSSGIRKVDFIKMDIEGAETNALKGAIETIRNFRPKLAIALYHSTKDFESIPKFINDLGIGYKYYLSHSTIYGEETMLFATTEK
jgi:FkbM family methyltransferase